jgi:hypothetical protein
VSRRILAIVGTRGPFERLVEALVVLRRRTGWRILVQHAGVALPDELEGWPMLPRAEVLTELDAADAVVIHGGSGTIRDALAAGHRPVVVPRLQRYGEHVNDHQLELVAALRHRVTGLGAERGLQLARALEEALAGAVRSSVEASVTPPLISVLRGEVESIARAPAAPRTRLIYAFLGRLPGRGSSRSSR